jgi:hypothetical protein
VARQNELSLFKKKQRLAALAALGNAGSAWQRLATLAADSSTQSVCCHRCQRAAELKKRQGCRSFSRCEAWRAGWDGETTTNGLVQISQFPGNTTVGRRSGAKPGMQCVAPTERGGGHLRARSNAAQTTFINALPAISCGEKPRAYQEPGFMGTRLLMGNADRLGASRMWPWMSSVCYRH